LDATESPDGSESSDMTGSTDPYESTDATDAVNDRLPGRRGQLTRRRLLDATTVLLETLPYRDVKVVDIAREAGTSPATFYQYFSDVEEAVLAIADEMASAVGPLLASLVSSSSWTDADGWAAALRVADGFIAVWDAHRSVLRLIDLATDEGDARFRTVRTRLLGAPAEAFVAVARHRGIDGGAPFADAGVLVSMLAHVAAHREGLEHWGATSAELRHSMARVIYTTITGTTPPSN
jgi:AcrR family transcriptional regulator